MIGYAIDEYTLISIEQRASAIDLAEDVLESHIKKLGGTLREIGLRDEEEMALRRLRELREDIRTLVATVRAGGAS